MRRTFLLVSIAAAMMSSACDSTRVKPISKQQIKTYEVIAGRVLDVRMLGEVEEKVTVCHFNPQFVVAVQTESGVKKLAIHSPAKTFMGEDPVGKSYRFHLSKYDNHYRLEGVIEDKYLRKEHFPIPIKEQLEGSCVLGSESTEGACGQGEEGCFVFKGNTQDHNNFTNKVAIVETWTCLEEIRNKYFKSGLLNKITSADFSEYNFAVVLIVFTGTQHLENGQLYEDKHKLYFSYDIWEEQLEVRPFCAWERLYVLKLSKKPL
jgi:hypothetical protein